MASKNHSTWPRRKPQKATTVCTNLHFDMSTLARRNEKKLRTRAFNFDDLTIQLRDADTEDSAQDKKRAVNKDDANLR